MNDLYRRIIAMLAVDLFNRVNELHMEEHGVTMDKEQFVRLFTLVLEDVPAVMLRALYHSAEHSNSYLSEEPKP